MAPEKQNKNLSDSLLFLFLLGSLANAQSHILQYNVFVTVIDGELLFSVLGYLNDELFFYYDSKSQTPEPRGIWLDSIMKTDTWKTENSNVKEIIKAFRIIMGKVMEQSDQNTDSHTFQEILGCELHKDGSIRGFLRFGYDGEDFLIFHSETLTWEAVHPAARSLENAFEAEPVETKIQKAKLEGDYCAGLQGYLEVWKEEKPVFPSLNLTQSKNPKEIITLKCRVYNFFPGDIKIMWYRNGDTLSQRDQEGGIILPSGDGTYQTWVSTDVYSEKSNYTCHGEHQGRNQSTSISLGPVSEANRKYGIPPALFFGVFVAAVHMV
ncbi:major histocompatibility complex class I-related gene protein isoform X1 [Sarcophilus harrisii]|uniref:Ig-like domain-containing protein n=1 Tax=Sarcophilus harrisii TaxID=9305 RepID=G3WSI9_SARHA|nr:major histocompatibility complex class I-related gene protein isoform X1 [Sarcophilus harrisii]